MLSALASYLAERRADWEYQEIALWGLNINVCDGNGRCFRREGCVFDDDAEMVIGLLLEADGVILASPNYCANVNSTMMSFIERTTRLSHRRLLKGKGALALSTSASPFDSAQAAEYLRRVLGSYGASVVPAFNIGSSLIVYDYGSTEHGELLRTHIDAFIAAVEDPAGHIPDETFGIDVQQLLRDQPEYARRLFRSDAKYFAARKDLGEKDAS
jgi:multimeric flavodoxin WrbA